MSRSALFASLFLVACSAAAPPPAAQPAATQAHAVPADAAVDAPPPPDAPDPAASAPAWVFHYQTKDRTETWTLRFAEGRALLDVDNARGIQHYTGTATDGASLAVDVSTGSAKLTLDCKHTKRALSAKCNDRHAKPMAVLDCYVPDFETPMPFAPAPGVAYVEDAHCKGYRLATP